MSYRINTAKMMMHLGPPMVAVRGEAKDTLSISGIDSNRKLLYTVHIPGSCDHMSAIVFRAETVVDAMNQGGHIHLGCAGIYPALLCDSTGFVGIGLHAIIIGGPWRNSMLWDTLRRLDVRKAIQFACISSNQKSSIFTVNDPPLPQLLCDSNFRPATDPSMCKILDKDGRAISIYGQDMRLFDALLGIGGEFVNIYAINNGRQWQLANDEVGHIEWDAI